mmetsp:Transcript_4937/g.14641  ORF Transcript_4937/g.14641 Transcript_4937/m.14641 type:complete len:385 (+) Transcript_4937:165-1319(+)
MLARAVSIVVMLGALRAWSPRAGRSTRRALVARAADAFHELRLRTGGEGAPSAEELSEALMEFGALSVTATDTGAGTPEEEALFREPPDARELDVFTDENRWRSEAYWARSEVAALFSTAAGGEAALKELRSLYGDAAAASLEASVAPLADQDWLAVQEAARPVVTVGQLDILLPWHETSSDPAVAARQLRVEGGAAFGTGEHQTTRMCCEWLQRANLPAHYTMLDYGCGSGILALTALRFGAACAAGVDIDVDCVAAAKRNAADNGFGGAEARFYLPEVDAGADAGAVAFVNARLTSAPDGFEPLPPGETFDAVVANILLNPLLALRDTIVNRVRADGILAISGVRAEQFDAVRDAYRGAFRDVRIDREEDGWLLIVCEDKLS